jgi:hypothetical protein
MKRDKPRNRKGTSLDHIYLRYILSPFRYILSPFRYILSPFRYILSPFRYILSPLRYVLRPHNDINICYNRQCYDF